MITLFKALIIETGSLILMFLTLIWIDLLKEKNLQKKRKQFWKTKY